MPPSLARALSTFLKTVPACLGSLMPISFRCGGRLGAATGYGAHPEHELSSDERQVIQTGLIDGPFSHPADRYRNDITYINCESVHSPRLAEPVSRIEE